MEFPNINGKLEKLYLTPKEPEETNNHFFSWVDLPKKERKITEIFKSINPNFPLKIKLFFFIQ